MPIFVVTYEYADSPEELDRIRPQHRAFLSELSDQGLVLASGPMPSDGQHGPGALIVVNAPHAEDVAHALDHDPFALAALITARNIRLWSPVISPW